MFVMAVFGGGRQEPGRRANVRTPQLLRLAIDDERMRLRGATSSLETERRRYVNRRRQRSRRLERRTFACPETSVPLQITIVVKHLPTHGRRQSLANNRVLLCTRLRSGRICLREQERGEPPHVTLTMTGGSVCDGCFRGSCPGRGKRLVVADFDWISSACGARTAAVRQSGNTDRQLERTTPLNRRRKRFPFFVSRSDTVNRNANLFSAIIPSATSQMDESDAKVTKRSCRSKIQPQHRPY